ncbi:peptidoglycan DD-metalloendopeptidase family protein [Hansschlegelia sp. KR7-227]|uniref:peptidoglycan DD-metalloendopeptidase family protein n=1 Tax=Hansschlegelia sp. KR7-227 TaxID=3400914 RepID=UPI003C0E127B
MRNFVPCLRPELLARVAVVALMSGATAACSSDTMRFGEDPFANPFSSSSNETRPEPRTTGAIQPAPTGRVERAPLSAPSAAQARPMRGFGGSSPSDGSYRSSMAEPRTTGSLAPARGAIGRSGSNWSAQGGSVVTLGQGDSIHTLSQRYGVPASAIMQANNLQSANGVGPGTQLVIPVYSASGSPVASAPAPVRVAAAPSPEPVRATPAPSRSMGGTHIVAPGETLSSLSRQYGTSRTELASANGLSPDAGMRIGQRLSVPRQAGAQQAAQAAAPVPSASAKEKMQFVQGPQGKGADAASAPAKPVAPVKTAAATPGLKPSVSAPPAPAFAAQPSKASAMADADNVKTAALKVDPAPAAEPAGPSFRWPVRGRVISAYGSKSSGSSNDGINLAVPEGTDVKASDDGVVAYSGSELKGFGNLVLIRHSNGWVTAYAHNSALNVKRGDTVRRGQIIAKSGATGSVSSPQLHFEVRKGSKTVDPLEHLPNV